MHRNHAANVKLWTEHNMDAGWKPKPMNKGGPEAVGLFPLSSVPIAQLIADPTREVLASETEEISPITYRPEEWLLPQLCKCGEKWKNNDEEFATGTYYSLTFKKNVMVYARKCVKNKCMHHFDGQSVGVFNYSGETLVSYGLLEDYHNCCVVSGMSWSGYLNKMDRMYNKVYCKASQKMMFMSQPTFVKVCFYKFHSLCAGDCKATERCGAVCICIA